MIKKIMKLSQFFVMASVVVTLLTACQQSPIRNPFNFRQEPKLGALPVATKPEVAQASTIWSTKVLGKQNRFSKLQPYITGTTIFAADHSGKVVALNRQSGKKIWQEGTHKKWVAGPVLVDNLLLLTTQNAEVIAMDPSDGHRIWSTKISSAILAPPSGNKNVILVHAMDGSVVALNNRNGEIIWQIEQSTPALTLHYSSTPLVVGDLALVGSSSGKLIALNIHSGLVEWERTISVPHGRSELQRMVDISADPIVIGDIAYVVTYQGKLAAVNVMNGALVWERDISAYQNMAFERNHIFVTDVDYSLWAINAFTGATVWKQDALAERYITGPAVVDNTVVVADRGGYLHFLDVDKGQLLNHLHLSGKFYQNPIRMGNEVLTSNYQGKLAVVHCTNDRKT